MSAQAYRLATTLGPCGSHPAARARPCEACEWNDDYKLQMTSLRDAPPLPPRQMIDRYETDRVLRAVASGDLSEGDFRDWIAERCG